MLDHVVMAFLDDIYLVSKPHEVREGYLSMERELWRHAKIRVHEGKTHIWNLAGNKPRICDELQRMEEVAQPGARVAWVSGAHSKTRHQGAGSTCGPQRLIRKHFENVLDKHQMLLEGIPRVPDVLSAWLLLLHCASARATYHLMVMRPEVLLEFAQSHDENLWC